MINEKYEIFNPHNKPAEELPVIYGFNNGGRDGWWQAVALSADGFFLAEHLCSHEGWMQSDLGILKGTRPDRHAGSYKEHYPDGYRMDFVSYPNVESHAGLMAAIKLANEKGDAIKCERAGVTLTMVDDDGKETKVFKGV